MRGYSKDGFGVNYCAENKADFKDKQEKTCFWGGIAGAVAVSAFSGGVTGTVIVPVAYRVGFCCVRENTEHEKQMAS